MPSCCFIKREDFNPCIKPVFLDPIRKLVVYREVELIHLRNMCKLSEQLSEKDLLPSDFDDEDGLLDYELENRLAVLLKDFQQYNTIIKNFTGPDLSQKDN